MGAHVPQLFFNPWQQAHPQQPSQKFSREEADIVRAFHASFVQYTPTPLHTLRHLAASLGVKNIIVKDEAPRFGLNAFKVLGGAYAVAKCLQQQLALPLPLTYKQLCAATASASAPYTFVTATDGNHGYGIAWTAAQLKQHAHIFMPKGSAPVRIERIRQLGATCIVSDYNYDTTVRMAYEYARQHKAPLVQDTAWEGYTDIPTWIMQGYMTLALEATEQLTRQCLQPTHVILQAGVGSFAGAVMEFLSQRYAENPPHFIIVEPHASNCLYMSACSTRGESHTVTSDAHTIMAGLNCGTPNPISWEIIRSRTQMFVSCPDWVAANGMRILASPIHGDASICAGESGGIGIGLLHWLLQTPAATPYREKLCLDATANVLCINTEGDTDPASYRHIVWYGAHAQPYASATNLQ